MSYGIKRDEVVVGIVARVQPHRRFDILLSAVARTIQKVPNLKFMIVGRGTHIEKVAKIPVKEMGISPHVIFTGYRDKDYAETLGCFDIKVFLVPGTDGACRAVREAMATGIPIIAARRGMLPEIVDDGINGLAIEDTPENLSQAIERLVLNPTLRKELGARARVKALSEFSLSTFGERVEEIYRKVIEA
jgi:glycosyltransferase involved in cell wall biosynthesis